MDVPRSMLLEPLDNRVLEGVEKAAVAIEEEKDKKSKPWNRRWKIEFQTLPRD